MVLYCTLCTLQQGCTALLNPVLQLETLPQVGVEVLPHAVDRAQGCQISDNVLKAIVTVKLSGCRQIGCGPLVIDFSCNFYLTPNSSYSNSKVLHR